MADKLNKHLLSIEKKLGSTQSDVPAGVEDKLEWHLTQIESLLGEGSSGDSESNINTEEVEAIVDSKLENVATQDDLTNYTNTETTEALEQRVSEVETTVGVLPETTTAEVIVSEAVEEDIPPFTIWKYTMAEYLARDDELVETYGDDAPLALEYLITLNNITVDKAAELCQQFNELANSSDLVLIGYSADGISVPPLAIQYIYGNQVIKLSRKNTTTAEDVIWINFDPTNSNLHADFNVNNWEFIIPLAATDAFTESQVGKWHFRRYIEMTDTPVQAYLPLTDLIPAWANETESYVIELDEGLTQVKVTA